MEFELELHAVSFILIRKNCVYMCTTLKNFSYLDNVQCVYQLAKMCTGKNHLEIPEIVGSDDSVNLLHVRCKNLGIILTGGKVFHRPRSALICSTFDWIEPFSKRHDPFIPEVQWLY